MQYLLHSFGASCNRVETLLMKHQRGKVSKPRVEQADKEVKSWSPSQDTLTCFRCFFFS